MMSNRYLIGLLLGLTSAVVFASAASGGLFIRLILFVITSLPIFLAGLGWGTAAAVTAALTGSAAVALLGWKAAILFLASQAAPAVILAHLALLSRDVPMGTGGQPLREWYPPGRLVIWAALLAGIPSALWLLLFAGDLEQLKAALTPVIGQVMKAQLPPENAPSDEDIKNVTEVVVSLLPAASAIAWMLALIVNLWLAGRIVTASGGFIRPWPDLAAITYPPATPFLLAGATLASFAGGWLGLGTSGFAAPLLFAYVLLGLAVVHFITRGQPWRPFLLWALYTSLLLVNAPLALPLALLGLAEPVFHFRARAAARPPAPKP